MTHAAPISLSQQIEAVEFACQRQAALAGGQSVKPSGSRSREEFDLKRLQAARASLDWLRRNETELRAWVAAKKASA